MLITFAHRENYIKYIMQNKCILKLDIILIMFTHDETSIINNKKHNSLKQNTNPSLLTKFNAPHYLSIADTKKKAPTYLPNK